MRTKLKCEVCNSEQDMDVEMSLLADTFVAKCLKCDSIFDRDNKYGPNASAAIRLMKQFIKRGGNQKKASPAKDVL